MPGSNKQSSKRMTLATFHQGNGAGTPSKPAGATAAYKALPPGDPKHALNATNTGVSMTTAPTPKPTAYQRAWADIVGGRPTGTDANDHGGQ